MTKNQWQFAEFAGNMILFRNNAGKFGCVTDLCAHKGVSLSKGCVSDGNIKCQFHDIEYFITSHG